VHLVGFIIIIYHDARSPERQNYQGSSKLYFVYNNNQRKIFYNYSFKKANKLDKVIKNITEFSVVYKI